MFPSPRWGELDFLLNTRLSTFAANESGPYNTFELGEGQLQREFYSLDKLSILKREGTRVELASGQLHTIARGDSV